MMASDELRTVLSPLLWGEEPLLWITENSYVHVGDDDDDDDDDSTVEDRHKKLCKLHLTDTRKRHELSIYASTLEEAIICLDYLVDLKDTHFQKIGLSGIHGVYTQFGVNNLEKILQNSQRRIRFSFMFFTPDHCRALASSGTQTNIEFFWCEFQDEGAAFVEASAARQDETSGPAKLCFVRGRNPFNDRNWALFLSQQQLESLELRNMHLNSEASCRAVATAEVRCLTLGNECSLEDGGAALVESVRQGRGPKEL
jgi:hypothetical protein